MFQVISSYFESNTIQMLTYLEETRSLPFRSSSDYRWIEYYYYSSVCIIISEDSLHHNHTRAP